MANPVQPNPDRTPLMDPAPAATNPTETKDQSSLTRLTKYCLTTGPAETLTCGGVAVVAAGGAAAGLWSYLNQGPILSEWYLQTINDHLHPRGYTATLEGTHLKIVVTDPVFLRLHPHWTDFSTSLQGPIPDTVAMGETSSLPQGKTHAEKVARAFSINTSRYNLLDARRSAFMQNFKTIWTFLGIEDGGSIEVKLQGPSEAPSHIRYSGRYANGTQFNVLLDFAASSQLARTLVKLKQAELRVRLSENGFQVLGKFSNRVILTFQDHALANPDQLLDRIQRQQSVPRRQIRRVQEGRVAEDSDNETDHNNGDDDDGPPPPAGVIGTLEALARETRTPTDPTDGETEFSLSDLLPDIPSFVGLGQVPSLPNLPSLLPQTQPSLATTQGSWLDGAWDFGSELSLRSAETPDLPLTEAQKLWRADAVTESSPVKTPEPGPANTSSSSIANRALRGGTLGGLLALGHAVASRSGYVTRDQADTGLIVAGFGFMAKLVYEARRMFPQVFAAGAAGAYASHSAAAYVLDELNQLGVDIDPQTQADLETYAGLIGGGMAGEAAMGAPVLRALSSLAQRMGTTLLSRAIGQTLSKVARNPSAAAITVTTASFAYIGYQDYHMVNERRLEEEARHIQDWLNSDYLADAPAIEQHAPWPLEQVDVYGRSVEKDGQSYQAYLDTVTKWLGDKARAHDLLVLTAQSYETMATELSKGQEQSQFAAVVMASLETDEERAAFFVTLKANKMKLDPSLATNNKFVSVYSESFSNLAGQKVALVTE